jgi:hypothetical protein
MFHSPMPSKRAAFKWLLNPILLSELSTNPTGQGYSPFQA